MASRKNTYPRKKARQDSAKARAEAYAQLSPDKQTEHRQRVREAWCSNFEPQMPRATKRD